MATIGDKEIINKIVDCNGVYPGDDPRNPVVRIVKYTHYWGDRTYGVVYKNDKDWFRYENESDYARGPFEVVFMRKDETLDETSLTLENIEFENEGTVTEEEVKKELSTLVDSVTDSDGVYIVVRDNVPVAVLSGLYHYSAMQEVIDSFTIKEIQVEDTEKKED